MGPLPQPGQHRGTHARHAPLTQIEAKIGVLIDRGTQSRLRLPVFTETIVDAKQLNLRFESNMSMAQHRHFNQLLNQAVAFSAQAAPPDRITYRHQKEIDSFYDERDPDTGHMVHMRVTRDAVTHEVKPGGIVAKKRIADINVFAPNRPFDYRISINTETPVPAPQEGSEPSFMREKDRLSYTHQNMNIDLTQVILPNKVRTTRPLGPADPSPRSPCTSSRSRSATRQTSCSTPTCRAARRSRARRNGRRSKTPSSCSSIMCAC